RHTGADGGGIRARRLLRLLAVPRLSHAARHPRGVPAQPQSGRGAARRLLEPAVVPRPLLRVRDDGRREDHAAHAAARIAITTWCVVRSDDFRRRILASADHNLETVAVAVRGWLDFWRALSRRARLPDCARVRDKSPPHP